LALDEGRSPEANALLERLEGVGVEIRFESARELRRMSALDPPPELLAMRANRPTRDVSEAMRDEGLALALVGLRYPANVGFILRSLEVAGGSCAAIDSDWGDAQFEEALRVSMRADRFMPVFRESATDALQAARKAGRQIIALETHGKRTPWEVDLDRPTLVLVGSETHGIPDALARSADEVVRIPIGGFIPSYNVQAAVGIVLGEWLRQSPAAEDPSGGAA